MRDLLLVAFVVTLSGFASAEFRGPVGEIYNSWDPTKDAIYVKDFDHLAPLYTEQAVHEEEHSRKKRNAEEAAHFAAQANPITKACDRPGYTGQYCEFPICFETNFFVDPEQFLTPTGYLVDVADLGNCTQSHEIIVDETMGDIRIEIQSRDNVNPSFQVYDANGYFGTPDGELKQPDRYEAHFNKLPPGYYRIQGAADSTASRCLLQATSQTIMTISGGFSTDERDRNDFPNRDAAVHEFNSIMVHLNGARSPAQLKTISVIGTNNYVFRPRILDKRYSCSYEYYFDSMFCMTQGAYAMIVEGVDFNGNPFRRAATFDCKPGAPAPSTAPATTTTAAVPTGCDNGGVLLYDGAKTSCVCQDHWTGSRCEKPLCINGGTLIDGKCFCTNSFEGVHCQDVRCEPNSDHGFGTDRPTLILVVRVREQMNDVMQQVMDAVDKVADNLQFDANYFSRFQVVYFNDYTNFKTGTYENIQQFNADFFKATISGHTDGACTDAVIGAAATALTNLAITANSYIYVITDALSDDADSMTDALMQWNSYWKAYINFIYVNPTADSGCLPDLSDSGFRKFENIANSFSGLAMHVSDRTKVYDVFYNHLNIIYKSQLMLTVDREECGNGLVKTVTIDKVNENLIIMSNGKGFYPLITNPMGEYLNEDTLKQIVKQDYLTIWKVADPIPGNYYIRMTANPATAACNLRAYQASYQTPGPPQAEVFWTITTDVDQDGQFYQPFTGIDNHPVFHVENLGENEDWDHAFSFLNMYAWRGGQEVEIYASNGLYRDGCSYNFYFPSFRCRGNEKLHFEFYLRTAHGFYIQRAGVMDCYTFFLPPMNQTDCQNGGVMMNETCLCLAHFTGDKCQTTVCENGGTPFFGAQCACPSGWGGPFCAFAVCDAPGPAPTYGYHVDMAFLVEVTKNGVEQLKQLATYLPGLLRDIASQHGDWIDRVVLIGYNSKDVLGMVDAPMGNPQKIMDALNAWGSMDNPDEGCIVKVWEAIYQLLNNRMDGPKQRRLPRRSIVNIFQASVPDNQGDVSQVMSTSEELLETNALTNVFQWLDPSSDTRWSCGGKQSDFQYLEQAARRGDGKMYTLENFDIPAILKSVPTLFSSSLVYKYHNEDCTTAQMVHFPIDAYTQTVSAIVAGQKATVDLYKYDGIQFNPDGYIRIYKNDMEQIVEFRNPCDSGWDPLSQYCMYFDPSALLNNADATAHCKKNGAFLVDDFNDAKSQYIIGAANGRNIWLGLQWTSNGWVFQHDEGSTTPATANFWDGGKIPDGSTGKCAYFNPKAVNGYWFAADCTAKYQTVCQKHIFDNDYEPATIADDDLSPGKYFLTVKTDAVDGWRGCDVDIRVQSDLNVEFGFVDGLRKDSPHPVANVDSNSNRVVSSISVGQGKTDLSILQHVLLRADSNQNILLEAATYSYRFGCSYEYYSQPLNCDLTNGQDFEVVHIGEDDTGNTFQRYSTSLCYKWNVCLNGGVYSNGACLCSDYWTGDDCRTPHCQHGVMNPDGRSCKCDDGWGGDACQMAQCKVDSKTVFSNDNKILALIIEKSQNTAAAIRDMSNNFKKIVAAIQDKEPNWITTYILHTFTYTGSVDDTVVLRDIDDVIAHLNQFADDADTMLGSCQQPLWDAVHGLFTTFTPFLKGSEVLIITASAPLDADASSVQSTMELFDTSAPTVDFIHIEGVCEGEEWAKGLEQFYYFFMNTGGTMFRVQPAKIGAALTSFIPSRYAAQSLTIQSVENCKDNTMYIQVDTRMSEVYIMVGGKDASASVVDPLGNPVGYNEVYSADEQKLWWFSPRFPGIYAVTINSGGRMCFPTVYGYGGAQIVVGYIQDYNTADEPLPYAVYGKVNFPVYHVVNRENVKPGVETLYMANTYIQTIWNKQGKMYDSDIDRRTGCSFEYIGNAFTCANKDQVMTMISSGVDDYNQAFSRESLAWCKGGPAPASSTTSQPITIGPVTIPTTTAPTPAKTTLEVAIPEPEPIKTSDPRYKSYNQMSQLLSTWMNTSVNPCDDFYTFTCGAGTPGQGMSFDISDGTIAQSMVDRLSQPVSTFDAYPLPVRQMKWYYDVCLGGATQAQWQAHSVQIFNDLRAKNPDFGFPALYPAETKAATADQLSGFLGYSVGSTGVTSLVDVGVDTDWKDPHNKKGGYAFLVDQPAVTYVDTFYTKLWDIFYEDVIDSFLDTINAGAKLLGIAKPDQKQALQDATDIADFDFLLATKYSTDDTIRRQYARMYNPYSVDGVQKLAPFLNWNTFFGKSLAPVNAAIDGSFRSLINEVDKLALLSSDIANGVVKPRTVNNYLWVRSLETLGWLPTPDAVRKNRAQLKGYRRPKRAVNKKIRREPKVDTFEDSIVSAVTDRENFCQSKTTDFFMWANTRLYVDVTYPTDNDKAAVREQTNSIIRSILVAFRAQIDILDWMSPASKKGAYQKIDNLVVNIAYPDWVLDDARLTDYYKTLNTVQGDTYLGAVDKLNAFGLYDAFSPLVNGVPADRTDFSGPSAITNAWYQPEVNSITFPGGILNAPFYDADYPAALNYGGLGVIAGHELTHGFDDEGVQWEGTGILSSWMDDNSTKSFTSMAKCVVDEYSNFCPLPEGLPCVDGSQTQGENIADNGGIQAAYKAFKAFEALHGPDPLLPGDLSFLNADQLFFIGFAQVWCQSPPDMVSELLQILVDPHSPSLYRVLGTVQNIPAFQKAFNCPLGSTYAPVDHCNVWTSEPTSGAPLNARGEPNVPENEINVLPIERISPQDMDKYTAYQNSMATLEASANLTVEPCDDFYHYSCGNFPGAKTTFADLNQVNYGIINDKLNDADYQATITASTALTKLKTLYTSCKAEAKQSTVGTVDYITPKVLKFRNYINQDIPLIGGTGNVDVTPENYGSALGYLSFQLGIDTLVSPGVDTYWPDPQATFPDTKNNGNQLFVDQPTTYHVHAFYEDANWEMQKPAYAKTVKTLVEAYAKFDKTAALPTDSDKMIDAALELEKTIAIKYSGSDADRRLYARQWNPLMLDQFPQTVDWDKYFSLAPQEAQDWINANNTVVINEIEKTPQLFNYLAMQPDDSVVVNYLFIRLLLDNSGLIPCSGGGCLAVMSELARERVPHHTGRSRVPRIPLPSFAPLNDEDADGVGCASEISVMADAQGRVYVDARFPTEAERNKIRDATSGVMRNIVNAMMGMIIDLDWMSQNSKMRAINKAANIQVNVAFPDFILDNVKLDDKYLDLSFAKDDSYYAMLDKVTIYSINEQYKMLTALKADRTDFLGQTAVVNAWYAPELNSITFPAGILQPPFFDVNSPAGLNYGGMGVVAGHELTHGFDDEGVQWDYDGRLLSWMDVESQVGFNTMAQCVIDEYNTFCPLDASHSPNCTDGVRTQGENIADNGGIHSAWRAYEAHIELDGSDALFMDRVYSQYTNNQLYFLNFAQVWCMQKTYMTESYVSSKLMTDPHSLGPYRVWGTLQNMFAFQANFNCPRGSAYAPEQHCSVWVPTKMA